jgi:hypothetical protein
MASPSEIQKIYITNLNGASYLSEMLCELFDPKILSPPPPKPNLFKSLFSSTPVDREELCTFLGLITSYSSYIDGYFSSLFKLARVVANHQHALSKAWKAKFKRQPNS